MIIVKIIGGLGNQMFQYAYAKALQVKGYDVKIDISAFDTYKLHGGYQLDKYNIDLKASTKKENNKFYKNDILSKVFRRLGYDSSNIIGENSLLFDGNLLDIEEDNYVSGYFQTELYFKNLRETLYKEFIVRDKYSFYTKEMAENILNQLTSCSIHVRRGDFINNTNITIHGSCDLSYYIQAVDFMNLEYGNLQYFVFSDDITWVKENLKIEDAKYIQSEEIRLPHEDIYLMSLCSHNIIANSSFSWWGAWLNQNSQKMVIAPKRWFMDEKLFQESADIVCENWKKI